MAENPRIEELRRRVQADPASIAFAALAEEFRRVGRYDDAVETCRTGLMRHPAYLSARVTLGRALIETGDFDAAREELETVLRSAPENLAAIRGLAQIHERLGHSTEMDPHLADLMQTMHAEQLRAAAMAPPEPPPASAEPEVSFAPEPEPELASEPEATFEPEPSFEPEPTFASPPPISLAPEPINPMAPQPVVVAPRETVSLEEAPGFPLDEDAEPPSTDPFAAFAPMASPAPKHDLSFDLSTAFAIQPKAAPPAEPAVDLGMAPFAAPVEEIPEESIEAELQMDAEPPPEPDVEPVFQMTADSGPDPATLATLARLERFLGAIESLRA